jgi:hypothetical protein
MLINSVTAVEGLPGRRLFGNLGRFECARFSDSKTRHVIQCESAFEGNDYGYVVNRFVGRNLSLRINIRSSSANSRMRKIRATPQ